MINYSIAMREKFTEKGTPQKAPGTAQYTQLMTLNKFTDHINLMIDLPGHTH